MLFHTSQPLNFPLIHVCMYPPHIYAHILSLSLSLLTSPSISMTNLSTPWAAGCWGPKFIVRLVTVFPGTGSVKYYRDGILSLLKSKLMDNYIGTAEACHSSGSCACASHLHGLTLCMLWSWAPVSFTPSHIHANADGATLSHSSFFPSALPLSLSLSHCLSLALFTINIPYSWIFIRIKHISCVLC